MVKKITPVFLLLVTSWTCITSHILTHEDMIKPRKIIAFTCKGGSAHNNVCNLIKTTLKRDNVTIVDAPTDITSCCFRIIPFVTLGSFKARDSYDIFNYVQKNQWIRTLNFVVRHNVPGHYHSYRKMMEKKFIEFFKKEKPDMVISGIHYINYAASQAAQKLNIPYLIVTLDAELSMWLQDMEHSTNKNVRIAVEAMTPHMQEQIKEKKLSPEQINVIGFPLREEFWTPKNPLLIKQEWGMPLDKKVVMLTRGGNGTMQFLDTIKLLKKTPIPLHLVVCIGKNGAVGKKLRKLKLPAKLTMTIVPFTPKIADLMVASDAIITLPSPTTCSEALHLGLPTLFDLTQPTLFWERRTIDWIQPHDVTAVVRNPKHMIPALMGLLSRQRPGSKCNALKFSVEIQKLVDQMVPPTLK